MSGTDLAGRVARPIVAIALLTAALALFPTPASAQSGEITIEKSTNGADADAAPGPSLQPGADVDWTYVVTISGSETLYDLIVSDSSGVVPNCDITGDGNPDGTHIHPGPLDGGQSFRCFAQGTVHRAGNGTFSASGKVKAFDFSGASQYEDQDPSHYTPIVAFVASPKVSLQSLVNGADADSSPGPYVAEDTPIILTYVVTNSGNVPLTSITVENSAGIEVNCGPTGNIVAGPIAPGASATCTSTTPVPASESGLQTHSATVEASAADPASPNSLSQVTSSDPLNYTPVRLPGALAFTGPSHNLALVGLSMAMVGGALWLGPSMIGRRRSKTATQIG
ncbi:MAG: DUF7507 domain-containing protein [Acidimicrobiales bacterium]